MGTGEREIGFCEFREQPFHLILLERHVDFNGGVTGNGCSDSRAHGLEVHFLILPR